MRPAQAMPPVLSSLQARRTIWYEDFSQTTDDEVRDLLERAGLETTTATSGR